MRALALILLFAGGLTRADEAPPVPCKTIDDCWLRSDGTPIHRPKRLRGRKLPLGDCGARLYWLNHILRCEANICVAHYRRDMC
jgi:hypothetical protein